MKPFHHDKKKTKVVEKLHVFQPMHAWYTVNCLIDQISAMHHFKKMCGINMGKIQWVRSHVHSLPVIDVLAPYIHTVDPLLITLQGVYLMNIQEYSFLARYDGPSIHERVSQVLVK